jgi:hypothetical protein
MPDNERSPHTAVLRNRGCALVAALVRPVSPDDAGVAMNNACRVVMCGTLWFLILVVDLLAAGELSGEEIARIKENAACCV